MFYTLLSFIILILLVAFFSYKEKLPINQFLLLSQTHTKILLGIATFLIVLTHVANYKGVSFLIPLGGVGTVLFLLISGYGLNESFKKNGLTDFFKKRFLKILIPYWLMVFIFWAIHWTDFNVPILIKSLVLLNRLPFMWFIQFIMIWYVLFYIGKRFFNIKNGIIFLLLLGVVFIFVFQDTTQGEKALAFPIGVALSQYAAIKHKLISKKYATMFLFFAIGATFSVVFFLLKITGFDTVDNYLMMNVVQILMKVPLVLFIIQFTYHFKMRIFSGLMLIGTYAYEVYLSHTLLIPMIKNDSYLSLIFFGLVMVLAVVMKKIGSGAYETIASSLKVN